ncbi:hypothetical protein ABK046_51490, partial [Streptomyces caeruleatus]
VTPTPPTPAEEVIPSGTISIKLAPPNGDHGTAMVQVRGVPTLGMSLSVSDDEITLRWVPETKAK